MPADMNDYFKKKKPSQPKSEKNKDNKPQNSDNNPLNNLGKATPFVIAIVAIAFFLIVFKPFTIINSGEIGIKITTGKFEDKPLEAGLHFFIPVIQKIIPINTKIRLITYSNSHKNTLADNYGSRLSSDKFGGGLKRNSAIAVLDKRGLTVNVDIAVQYRLRAESAPKTIQKWGSSWEEKIINSKVREVVRDVVGQYTAERLPEMRNEIAKAIQTKVRDKVDALDNKPVILSSVELRNIVLPAKIKEKIEEVQAAKQDVTIAEQRKEKAKQQAQRAAEIAKGVAQKKRIEAQGEADRIRIEAQEQAKANKLISDSLTPALLQLEQIKTQLKFNEALKVNKDAQIFLTPGGAVPNIWVDAKSKNQRLIGAQ